MRLLAVLIGAVWLCCQTAQAQVRTYDEMIAARELKVAVYKDFAPYSFEDAGQARGVDVELAEALAKALGVHLTLIWAPAGEKLDDDLRDYIWRASQLHNQQLADLMMRVPYDRDYSQKRNELGELENGHVVMFGPYQNEQWQVAYDRRRLDKVGSVAVFEHHPIGVEVDSVPSFYLTSVFNGMLAGKTHHYPGVPQAFAAMKAGEVDAVMAMRRSCSTSGSSCWRRRSRKTPGKCRWKSTPGRSRARW